MGMKGPTGAEVEDGISRDGKLGEVGIDPVLAIGEAGFEEEESILVEEANGEAALPWWHFGQLVIGGIWGPILFVALLVGSGGINVEKTGGAEREAEFAAVGAGVDIEPRLGWFGDAGIVAGEEATGVDAVVEP